MAKFNYKNTIPKQLSSHKDVTQNHAGGLAFNASPELRLYTRVATSLLGESKYYKEFEDGNLVAENQDSELFDDVKTVAKSNPKFILQLAKYARNNLNLRSIPTALLVEASLINETKPFVRDFTPSIVRRPDQLTEAVAYLQAKLGNLGSQSDKESHSVPNSLKRGLADVFSVFDEYQLGKYDRPGKVKLKDVWRLVHPHPQNKSQKKLWGKLLDGNLDIPSTWETYISEHGSNKETWEEIMPDMPVMATLRNLRNFLDNNCDLTPVLEKLHNPTIIKKSKQLPFRFLSAYRAIQGHTNTYSINLLDALEDAIDISCENLPHFDGTTFVTSDNSGSMTSRLSERSTVSYKDIANMFNAIAHKLSDNSISSIFAGKFAVCNISRRNGILGTTNSLNKLDVGYSTDAWMALEYLLREKKEVDRIFLFSDMQCYNSYGDSSVASLLKKYRNTINPDCLFYSVDLAGYGELQLPEDDPQTAVIAGWSEKILQFAKIFEEDGSLAIEEIQKIKP